MADRKVTYGIDFKVNKTGLQELNRLLSNLGAASSMDNVTKEIRDAGVAAQKLQTILNQNWNAKLNQLDLSGVKKGIGETWTSVKQLKAELSKQTGGAEAFNKFGREVLNTNAQLKESSKLLDGIGKTMGNTIKWGISASIFNNISNSIQQAWSYSQKLDTSLNDIRIVTGKSADEMERFARVANNAAGNLGASTLDYTEAALIYYQQGDSDAVAQAKADVTLKTANVTGQSGQEVSEQLTAVWNGYKVSAAESELYIDKLAAVAAATASDLEELSTGMGKVASAANLMGVDVDQLNATLATVVSVTRQAPESVGTAFKTIYARMGDIEAGIDTETTLSGYTEKMAEMGVNVLDARGNLRDMGTVIEEVGGNWGKMSREQQIALSQIMAGTRQYNNLLSLFDNWDMYTDALNTSANAAGTLNKQQDIYMESTEAHLQRLSTEWEETYDIMFDTDSVNAMTDATTGLLSIFNKFLDSIGGGLNVLTYFGASASRIFSKQISGGIEKQIRNFETMKKNLSGDDLKKEVIDTVQAGRVEQGKSAYVADSAGLQKEAEIAAQIQAVKSTLTDEEYKNLTVLQQQAGAAAEQKAYAEGYKDLLVEIGLKETALTETIELRLKKAKNITKEAVDNVAAIENAIGILEKNPENIFEKQEVFQGEDNKISEIIDQEGFDDLVSRKKLGYGSITDKEVENLKLVREGQGSGKKAVKTLNKLYEIQNKKHLENLTTQKQIVDILDRKKLSESESYKISQAQGDQAERQTQTLLEQEKRQQNIKNTIDLISNSIGALTAISGLVKSISNPDLSGWEKLESIFFSMLSLAPQLVSLGTSLATIGTKVLAEQATGVGADLAVDVAKTAINTKKTKKAFSEVSEVVKDTGKVITKTGAEATIATGGFKAMGIGLKSLGVSALAALAPFWPLIAAIGAVTAAFMIYDATTVSAKEQTAAAAEEMRKASENLEEVKNQYDSLNSSINSLQSQENALKNMTKGTQEWRLAVLELNNEVLTLAEKYPELLQDGALKKNIDGVLQIDEAAIEKVLEKQAGAIENAQNRALIASISVNEAAIRTQKENLRASGISYGANDDDLYDPQSRKAVYLDGEIIYNAFKDGVDLLTTGTTEDIEEALNKAGANLDLSLDNSQIIDAVKEQADSIRDVSIEIEKYTKQISEATKQLISSEIDKLDIDNIYVREIVEEKTAEGYDEEYQKQLKIIEGKDTGWGTDELIKVMQDNPDILEAITGKTGIDVDSIKEAFFGNKVLFEYMGEDNKTVEDSMTMEDLQKNYARYLAEDIIKEESEKNLKNTEDSLSYFNSLEEGLGNFLLKLQDGSAQDFYTEDEIQKYKSIIDAIPDFRGPDGTSSDERFNFLNFDNGKKGAQKSIADIIQDGGYLDENEVKKNRAAEFDKKAKDTAEEMEVDENSFTEYIDQLERENDALEENEDIAIEAAKAHFELKKKMEELGSAIEDNEDLLDKLKKDGSLTVEEWEEVGPVITELQDIFGEHVDSNFLTDNLDDVMLALEGNEEAFNRLIKASAQEIVVDMDLPEEDSAILEDMINNIDLENIEIGTDLDTLDFYDGLKQLALNSADSVGDINKVLGQLGFGEVTMESVPVESLAVTEGKDGATYTDGEGNVHKINAEAYSAAQTSGFIMLPRFAKDKPIEFKGTGLRNLSNVIPKTPGGGSESKPKKQEKKESKKDVYHDVNVELEQIADNLSKVQDASDELFGQDLIDNYRKQYALLNKEIEVTADKLKIAESEQARLQSELSKNGVTFGEDGAMTNYFSAYDSQLAHVNSVIDHYNTLSASGQEAYQETLDQANEDFDKFVENMEEYDNLITDMLPDLQAEMEDAAREQIELKVDAFNMEMEIRLDLKEATSDWNEFKNKIIKGLDEDDILGNATAKLEDLALYYNEAGTGIIQAGTKDLDARLKEVKKAIEDNNSKVYSEDGISSGKTALEDLQEYYTELMSQMEDFQDLSDEIHESYLDMMDEAQEKFDEQIDAYSQIRDLIQHDMDIVSLIYGEESYSALSKFYEQQEENNNKQLDFQKQQIELWRAQMDSLEEGSEEWDAARDNWTSAVNDWNSTIQDSISNLQDKYLNTINAIFQELNNNVTNGMGLDYVSEEWDLINKNADRYLDSVNSIYEKQQLANKYQTAIDNTSSVSAQQKLNDLMQEEIKALEEKDKLSQYDIDRAELRYQIAMKQIALEEAQQNKSTMRLRRDSQGNYNYQYVADEDQVAGIQNEISDLYNQLYNLDNDQYKASLDELYSTWGEFQEKMAEAAQINDPELRAERELLLQEQYGELINNIVADNEDLKANLYQSSMSNLFDLYDQNSNNYDLMTEEQRNILSQFINEETNMQNAAFDNLFGLYNMNIDSFKNMTEEQKEALMGTMVPQWNSGVQSMIDKIAGEGGFDEIMKSTFEDIKEATSDYQESLKELQDSAGQSFEELKDGVNDTVEESKDLIAVNDELIGTYDKELDAIGGVIGELEKLTAEYERAAEAAKKATEEAHEYWAQQNQEAAKADKDITTNVPVTEDKKETATPVETKPAAPSLSKGSYVSVKPGTRWYANSYGGGPSGTARNGSIAYTSSNPYGYNISGLGWVKKSDIVGYDTGGYTGSWDKSGRIAMLHQKELVLNASDTENMLNTVSIVRDLIGSMGATVFNQISNIRTNGLNYNTNDNPLEQNVHITAEFPNANSAYEIEEALSNLVNRASQEIYK